MPSPTQHANLEKMLGIIPSNAGAQAILRSVWEFSDHQLFCVIRDNDGKPSKYRIDLGAFRASGRRADLLPVITLKKSDRAEEAFVHELLHLDLARRGFPRFLFRPPTDSQRLPEAEGVQNIADHVVMLPAFLALGYRQDRFLGSGPPPTTDEAATLKYFAAMDRAIDPSGYGEYVGAFLSKRDIHFDAVVLPNA